MPEKILHILSQRPSKTGSGITLESLVRQASQAGWKQAAVVGIPADEKQPEVGFLQPSDIFPIRFKNETKTGLSADLDFPIPGMSDVMPYPSSVWSTLKNSQLEKYRQVWTRHLEKVIMTFQPTIIHSNHVWLVSSLIKDVAPDIPVLTTCHATGLRQIKLCPHLAEEVLQGCRRNDHFFVLRHDHATDLARVLDFSKKRAQKAISLAGVGYREEIFKTTEHRVPLSGKNLIYVGKFSNAKGLPWLLDALKILLPSHPDLHLNVAGDGAGPEAEILRTRMGQMSQSVTMHGMLSQENLARLMGQCDVCILPSFYEGVPLVLVEAAACGCKLVSTELPGVMEQIAPVLGSALQLVPLPRLTNVDIPHPDDLYDFTRNLAAGISRSINEKSHFIPELSPFTWKAVFERVQEVWLGFSNDI
ncbi:MAG: glycosyltransferase family 4 protein [bacterium]|nr:glycosyltransferase family 4 protein [bacterium]